MLPCVLAAVPAVSLALEESPLKAAIVYSLLQYVQWPDEAALAAGAPLALCAERQGALWPHLTVRQHVAFGLEQQGLSPAEVARRVEVVAGRLGLFEVLERRPDALTLAERRRLALARALAVEPRVLLLVTRADAEGQPVDTAYSFLCPKGPGGCLNRTIDKTMKGKTAFSDVAPGDTLDFWRVEAVEDCHLLRLVAEMRLPGRAWLQFEVDGDATGSTIRQTAIFDAVGLAGRAYWYGIFPLHRLVFGGMLRNIARAAASSPTVSLLA